MTRLLLVIVYFCGVMARNNRHISPAHCERHQGNVRFIDTRVQIHLSFGSDLSESKAQMFVLCQSRRFSSCPSYIQWGWEGVWSRCQHSSVLPGDDGVNIMQSCRFSGETAQWTNEVPVTPSSTDFICLYWILVISLTFRRISVRSASPRSGHILSVSSHYFMCLHLSRDVKQCCFR